MFACKFTEPASKVAAASDVFAVARHGG